MNNLKTRTMKIKKGNLNFDQTGRAYPDNPHIKENWDCIWEDEGKYYKLVGDINNKEWEEVQLGEEHKQETLEEAAENYAKQFDYAEDSSPQLDFIEGAKWQAERMYSEDDIINALHSVELKDNRNYSKIYVGMKEWFEQSKNK
jgi:hypothetical protein